MGWYVRDIARELNDALGRHDWAGAQRLCERLIRCIFEEPTPCPEREASAILATLRRKRRFDLMARTAEAFILTGQDAPCIRRQYAQALIDQGLLLAPEPVLQALASTSLEGDSQVPEAHGLMGRLYKQRYLNASAPGSRYARAYFERALAEYLQTYRMDPAQQSWHGVNAVALLHRGRADGIAMHATPDPNVLAAEILETLGRLSAPHAFDLATQMEVLLALGRIDEAHGVALLYSQHPETDAFEAGSTLRQLQEVWRLTDAAPPGSTLLPLLRAALLRGEGGTVNTPAPLHPAGGFGGATSSALGGPVAAPVNLVDELERVTQARKALEKTFGSDKTVTLAWYETGLQRTRSVARIERLDGKGHGTGWLVGGGDFFSDRAGQLLLLTNEHVVNADGSGDALRPDQAQANFQGLRTAAGDKVVLEFEDTIVWSSRRDDLDATFLVVKGLPAEAVGLPLSTRKVRMSVPPPRVYIIGYPAGRDLELSLHDNVLLAKSDRVLHYRTPTEGGSSGSPVFDDAQWQVIGLHHAGGLLAPPSGNGEPYEANEGIAIQALQARTRS